MAPPPDAVSMSGAALQKKVGGPKSKVARGGTVADLAAVAGSAKDGILSTSVTENWLFTSQGNESSRKSPDCGYLKGARPTGFEPATPGSTVRSSNCAERFLLLPR